MIPKMTVAALVVSTIVVVACHPVAADVALPKLDLTNIDTNNIATEAVLNTITEFVDRNNIGEAVQTGQGVLQNVQNEVTKLETQTQQARSQIEDWIRGIWNKIQTEGIQSILKKAREDPNAPEGVNWDEVERVAAEIEPRLKEASADLENLNSGGPGFTLNGRWEVAIAGLVVAIGAFL
eukprot:TRINITY_DN66285_c0_g1_i1.p1 TRINITY_DN66285_c0_g1~~TRINITY_DN66285_c0_g1_i1.p1  ORF type:complete len:180 (+),score=22.14 TRINITY_DN66285_c0_g1_i1:103-642(+)